jgi:hypothetical protein
MSSPMCHAARAARVMAALAFFLPLVLMSSHAPACGADAGPIAVLASVKGKVEIAPAGGGGAQRGAFGRGLQAGDKVMVGPGGAATLFFNDGNVIELAEKSSVTVGGRADQRAKMGPGAGLPGEVYANVSKFVTGGSRQTGLVALSTLRGSGDRVPLLLAPRKTEVLEARPSFAWRAVDGATRYRLSVSGETGELWTREVAATRLDYPADVAELAAGADYLWEIQAFSDRGALAREDSYFRVVESTEAERVRADLARISTSAGGDESAAVQFLSGSYLFGRGLYRDAAAHFEKLCRLSPESPAPHEALGNVYRAVGLTDQAAAAYEKALDLARNP